MTTPSHPPAFSIESVTFAYGRHTVLSDLDLIVEEGDFLCVAGPNGAGKSTLLRLLSGAMAPTQGRVLFRGDDVHAMEARPRARCMAVVPQSEPPVFASSVRRVVLLGRHPWLGMTGMESAEDRAIAARAMQRAGIGHLAERRVTALSGGELHRVLLARALAQDTPVLLLDEPTAHLDLRHQVDVFALLAALHGEGRTVVCATHDLNLAAMYARRVLLLDEGRAAAVGTPAEVITEDTLRAVFNVDALVATDSETGNPHVRLRKK
jgi:iron complex transport system ATP-binding protein